MSHWWWQEGHVAKIEFYLGNTVALWACPSPWPRESTILNFDIQKFFLAVIETTRSGILILLHQTGSN